MKKVAAVAIAALVLTIPAQASAARDVSDHPSVTRSAGACHARVVNTTDAAPGYTSLRCWGEGSVRAAFRVRLASQTGPVAIRRAVCGCSGSEARIVLHDQHVTVVLHRPGQVRIQSVVAFGSPA